MFAKLLVAYLTLLVLALAVFGFVAAETTRKRVLAEIELRLESQAEMLATHIHNRSPSEPLDELVRNLGTQLETRFTVIDPDGKVLADSHAPHAEMENHNTRPEVIEARHAGRGKNVRYSDTVRYEMMYYALRLNREPVRDVIVRTALPLTRIAVEMREIYRAILFSFFGIALAGAGVTYLLARWITHPLRQIREVAQAITSGDLSRKLPLKTPDEMGSVAAAINRMSEELSLRLSSLKAESSKLEAVISGMQEGVVAIDQSGQILHCNDAAKRLLDIRVNPLGLKIWEAVRAQGIDAKVEMVLQKRDTDRTRLDIGGRVIGVAFCPMSLGQGAVLVAHDATEEDRYDRLRKEFVANVSHELRTPLSVIQGYIETLKEGAWRDEARAPEFLETMEKHVLRLNAIVADLLQLSKLESAGQILKPAPIEAAAFVEKIREEFQPLVDKKRQKLTVGAAFTNGFEADPDLLERAVGNLVTNALKYTPEEGRICLEARKTGDGVIFTVSDNGPGIPEEDLPRIFERFYRVDKSRSRDWGGTGLGLAIVKHVAQLHGGTVSVASRLGQGSTFTLRLPAKPNR